MDKKFFLPTSEIYALLAEKGVKNLFHANTVSTAITFINNDALLSRGFVEQNQLHQTLQKSDKEDVEFNVWDDVFVDGLDLHKKYQKANFYGPVLFVLKLDLLLSPNLKFVLVTKDNPMYWKKNQTWEDRYYSNIEDVKRDYLTGSKLDSRIMFTFRSPMDKIKLSQYLEFVGIDNPRIIINVRANQTTRQQRVEEYAKEHLEKALSKNNLSHVSVRYRHADTNIFKCSCHWRYTLMNNTNLKEFKRFFEINPKS